MSKVDSTVSLVPSASVFVTSKAAFFSRAVDASEVVHEVQMRIVLLNVLHQRRHILLDAEQHTAGIVELDVDVVQNAVTVPVVGRQIKCLLRRAGAFDRHRRLGEQRPAGLHLLHQFPGVGREVIAVVRGDAVLAERLDQPRTLFQSSFRPGVTMRRLYFTTRQPSRMTALSFGSKADTAALIQCTPCWNE
jgi:hypothetical protein